MVFYDLSPDFRIALNEARSLYCPRFIEQLESVSPSSAFTFEQPWPQIDVTLTRLVCATYLRENGITQGDRLSMASSVEMRLPLLDYKLVEMVIGLRKTNSDAKLGPKAWFKDALNGTLPDWIMTRPKRGFAPPVREWHDAIFAAYGDSLADGYLVQTGVLNAEEAGTLALGPFPVGAVSPLSFKALVLEQWCRQMLQH
jgi:asparagine synthase (glutamine-hydrolysing)